MSDWKQDKKHCRGESAPFRDNFFTGPRSRREEPA
jgi:hypothetical protein